jgi:phosphatidyl-myo-inositol dimannoside synthase
MAPQLLLSFDFPPMGGGIARWMGELAKRYPPDTLIVSTGRYPEDSKADEQLPTRIDRLPLASSRLRSLPGILAWSRRAAALALEHGVEFIWCGNIKPAAYPAWWTKLRNRVPYGILLHGGDLLILGRQVRGSLLKRRTARALLGSASVLVTNSTWTQALCERVLEELGLGRQQGRIRTVALGTDPIRFRPQLSTEPVRARYQLEKRRWLLSVARLARHKGHDVGIRTLARLKEAYPDLGYAIVGSGEELGRLQRLALSLGVANRVRFLGNVPDDDLPALYNCAEIYLGLSRMTDQAVEGFGISLVEASACGLPVVAGRAGGIPDAIHEGKTGLLVDPQDGDEVAITLHQLLDNPTLGRRLGAAGRQAVETYYNWDRVTAELAQFGHEYARSAHLERAT